MRLLRSPVFLAFVAIVLGSPAVSAQGDRKKSKEFEFTAWMEQTEAELVALGYIKNKAERVGVPVSEHLTVAKVPAAFIKGHCEHATHVVGAVGFPTRRTSKLPKAALGLAEFWLVPLTVTADKAVLKQRPMLDLVRADANLHAELVKHFGKPDATPGQIFAGLPGAGLGARELLPVRGSGGGSPFNFTPISVVRLLKRFDPHAGATERDADQVAEEILWTKELGIGDGTHQSLPRARQILQAAILENLNFEIGNPGDKDKETSSQAQAKLAAATKLVLETWRKAAEAK